MFSVPDTDDRDEDERRGCKRKLSLSSCEVCEAEEAKYRCPGCLALSCGLACVKRHKLRSGCCGVRDKTAFVKLSEFDEMNLLSDYRFLEDTARLRQRSGRDPLLTRAKRTQKTNIIRQMARRGKVDLKFLPQTFSRHRENRSYYHRKEKQLYWHLKIHFPHSAAVYSGRFAENMALSQILRGFVHPSQSDPVRRQKLKVYVLSPEEKIRVFMKAEQSRPDSPRYLELKLEQSLRENLMHQTVLEFPELSVALDARCQPFLSRAPAVGALQVTQRSKVSEEGELEDGEIQSEDDANANASDVPVNGGHAN